MDKHTIDLVYNMRPLALKLTNRNEHDAEDMIHDVLLRLLQINTFPTTDEERIPYLTAAFYNIHISRIRYKKAQKRNPDKLEPIDLYAVDDIQAKFALNDLLKIINTQLKKNQREALLLWAQGYPIVEICQITNLKPVNTRCLIHLARKHLKKYNTCYLPQAI